MMGVKCMRKKFVCDVMSIVYACGVCVIKSLTMIEVYLEFYQGPERPEPRILTRSPTC